jgi:hypothetical protein
MLLHNIPNELCVNPVGGMGNRLLVIISGLRLVYRGFYDNLIIAWRPGGDAGAPLDRLWQVPSPATCYLGNYIGSLFDCCQIPPIVRIPIRNRLVVRSYCLFRCVLDTKSIDELDDEFMAIARQLTPVAEITSQADKYDVSQRVGLHCRRTDFSPSGCGGYVPFELIGVYYPWLDQQFANFVEDNYHDDQLLLCSDSADTVAYFRYRFGKRLLALPHRHYPEMHRRSLDSTLEAAVDMILLSRCRIIVADSYSTFAQMASWLTNVPRRVWTRPQWQPHYRAVQ